MSEMNNDIDKLINSFRNADTAVNLVGRSQLKEWTDWTVLESQKQILNAGSVDTNELIQGMFSYIFEVSDGLVGEVSPSEKADEYAIYVEEGQGYPRKFPPIAALQGWADRHGIPVWALAKSISRKVTAPKKMFHKTFVNLDKKVDKELRKFAQAIASKL